MDHWTDSSYIDPKDEDTYNRFIAKHVKTTEAPVVLAEMIQFEKRLNAKGIKGIYLFPGYGELTRFLKSRYSMVQEIPHSIATSGES